MRKKFFICALEGGGGKGWGVGGGKERKKRKKEEEKALQSKAWHIENSNTFFGLIWLLRAQSRAPVSGSP
jgi:hypothetical protein